MFRNLRLRGTAGSVLWGYRTAASVRSWTISRVENQPTWQLVAVLAQVDAFQLRQTPLLFTAPRHGGMWLFPMQDVQIKNSRLYARLGHPEQ